MVAIGGKKMNNEQAANALERESPELFYAIRALVRKPMNPFEIRKKVLKETGDERLANLAECAAVYEIMGR